MPGGKQAYERKLEGLAGLRSGAPEAAVEPLRKALKDRSNYLVSKAAALAGDLRLKELIPNLLTAFDRFMIDAAKTDQQCWAKNAIVKALKDLGHDDPAVFLRGIEHVQMEPVWGTTVDTAGTLRGACALALVACALDRQTILTRLVNLLIDDLPVKQDAITALGQVPGNDTVLLLRLKALLGDKDSEVTGQCFDVLLEMAPVESVAFVARFLEDKDADVRSEAVAALAGSRETQAIQALEKCYSEARDPAFKTTILQSLAGARQVAAADFLLAIAERERPEHAAAAIESLGKSRFRDEFRERAAAVMRARSIPSVTSAFEGQFGPLVS